MQYRMICLLFLSIIVTVSCQSKSSDVIQLRNSVDFAYKLGNCFLDLIRGSSPPRSEEIQQMIKYNGTDVDFKSIYQRFKPFLQLYIGYWICFIIGLLFVIIMPLVGLFFCCCRCCGNCGGAAKPMDSKYANCKRVFFTICLALLNTIMLAGVVLAFINNQLMNEAIKNKDERVNALKQIDSAFNLTERGLDEIVKNLNNASQDLNEESKAAIEITSRHMDALQKKILGSGTDEEFMTKLNRIVQDIQTYQKFADTKKRYTDQNKNLFINKNMQTIQDDISKTLGYCVASSSKCKQLQEQTRNLKLNFNNKAVTKSLEDAKRLVTEIFNGDLKSFGNVTDLLMSISKKYNNRLKTDINDLIAKLKQSEDFRKAKKSFEDWINKLSQGLRAYQNQYNNATVYGQSLKTVAYNYDHLRMYVFIGFCCILLLIVFFYYLGLCFGMCGERPYEEASLCNRGVGANLLMAAVAFAFFFSWLIMLVTMIFFMVGGAFQTEVCRYATGRYPGGEKVLDNFISSTYDMINNRKSDPDSQPVFIANGFLDGLLNRCEDQSLLEAFNITNSIVDIQQLYEKYLNKTVDNMRNSARNVNALEDLPKYIRAIEDVAREKFDFRGGIRESAKPITQIQNLELYIRDLESLGISDLQKSITELKEKALVMANDQILVNKYFIALKFLLENIPDVKQQLETIKTTNDDRSNLVTATFKDLKKSFETEGDKIVISIFSRVRCNTLNRGVKKGVNALCITMLYPFNGYWYGLGVCLILFIPTIIFAVKLAGLYRKTEKYCSDYEEPDYMSYQGFYINPGDNIPLERKKKQSKGKRRQPT